MSAIRRALSIRQPWIFCIMALDKRVENRERADGKMPPMCKYRGELYLHASSKRPSTEELLCFEDLPWLDATTVEAARRAMPVSSIVAVCDVIGHVEEGARGAPVLHLDREPSEPLNLEEWWNGGFGLILDNIRALAEPVPCNGALGLWKVPPEVAAVVEAQR